MKRIFIELQGFLNKWYASNLTDDDLTNLEAYLCINPESGDIIPDTGGLRKLRFALDNKGKRGGARIVYIDFAFYEKIYLLDIYTKNKKVDLSHEEKAKIKKVVKMLEYELRKGGH